MTAVITRQDQQPPAVDTGRDEGRGASVPVQIWVLTGRSLRALRNPAVVLPSLLYPVIMLTLFSQIFRSIDKTPGFPAGVTYIDYLLPAIILATAVAAGARSGAALTVEMGNGIIARFKSMPVRTGSVLVARSLADTAQNAIDLTLTLLLGVVVFGFSPAGGVPGALGMVGIAVLVGFSVSWVFLALSAWLRTAQALEPITGVVTTVLMFASSAFVPLDSLPGWLQTVANVNPMSETINAARALALGTADASSVLLSVAGCAAVVLATAPVAIALFRRR
ncbi:ABC transporter permease [Virgisporangium ochraceum]|uniref:Transport permease protein n=1 Tax=Virgisporangium ochraceum TaxID=65505 RepID=A0A8J4A5N6_9ACTN|nr:ABC transporter permease [Virgisporangium ochraceum]GIJ73820.1 transport permease protein [Virgisporangium ochraceum]